MSQKRLNLAICGLLKPGDRVVTSSIEHNSVMRPLRALEKKGIRLTVVQCWPDGRLDLEAFREAVMIGTRLVVVTHASNVTGTILPIKEIAAITHQAGALLLVDCAQTAGVIPLDQPALGIDLLAFTGHKGLYGRPELEDWLLRSGRYQPAAANPPRRYGQPVRI